MNESYRKLISEFLYLIELRYGDNCEGQKISEFCYLCITVYGGEIKNQAEKIDEWLKNPELIPTEMKRALQYYDSIEDGIYVETAELLVRCEKIVSLKKIFLGE